jgi:hypothetical protein
MVGFENFGAGLALNTIGALDCPSLTSLLASRLFGSWIEKDNIGVFGTVGFLLAQSTLGFSSGRIGSFWRPTLEYLLSPNFFFVTRLGDTGSVNVFFADNFLVGFAGTHSTSLAIFGPTLEYFLSPNFSFNRSLGSLGTVKVRFLFFKSDCIIESSFFSVSKPTLECVLLLFFFSIFDTVSRFPLLSFLRLSIDVDLSPDTLNFGSGEDFLSLHSILKGTSFLDASFG